MNKVSSLLSSIIGKSDSSIDQSATVTSIFIYPIKSCRGVSVPRAPITSTGFRWDRNWLIVNSNGRGYTQRVEPKLALIEVELPKDAFNEEWEPTDDSFLVVKAPGMKALNVPLKKEDSVIDGISLFEWSGSANDEGDEAADWFSDYLGKPSRLVRFNNASEIRTADPNYAQGYSIVFSDLFPFLIVSQGSLNKLNELLQEPISINRFRPNIVVDGCDPYSEDLWKNIKINNLTFDGVKLCSRCKIPSINQENATSCVEPNATLMKVRSDHVLNLKNKQGKTYFGLNLVCKESLSAPGIGKSVALGDPVFVLKKLSSALDIPV